MVWQNMMKKVSNYKSKTNSIGFSFRYYEIWVDKETGVNYVFHASGYSGGLTPLLDRDGKPVVSPIINR